MTCLVCGAALNDPDTGRPPRYCSQACRQRAYRARQSVVGPVEERRPPAPRARTDVAPLRERAVPHLSVQELRAWRGALEVQARILRELEVRVRDDASLTLNEFDLLYQLWRAPGSVRRVGDLAEDVLVTPGGITRLVDRLAERGLVERRREEGRQAVEVALTDVGEAVLDRGMDVMFSGLRERFVDRLTTTDVAHLVRIWSQLNTD